ncbi:VCBS repeat-containing protein [Saccharomonospora sp. NPDC006951]
MRVASRVVAAGFACATLAAASFTALPPAQGQGGETRTTQADVDGDGQLDDVVLKEASANNQTLTFRLASGGSAEVTFEGDTSMPLQPPRPVDVNGDGQDEVVVAEMVGANTLTLNVWSYDVARTKVFPVTTPNGGRLQLFEGGGIAAVTGYGCARLNPGSSGRDLIGVKALIDDPASDAATYTGTRTTYHVTPDGKARTVNRLNVTSVPRDDPALTTDPQACTPAQGQS